MGIHIGGKNSYKQREFKDVVVSFQWVNDEPAMILWPKVKRTLGAGAHIICLSAAFKYANSDGSPTPYLIEQSFHAARIMGMDELKVTVHNIADAIHSSIPDLVDMPPTLKSWKEEVHKNDVERIGEMTIKVDGETILNQEITAPETMQ